MKESKEAQTTNHKPTATLVSAEKIKSTVAEKYDCFSENFRIFEPNECVPKNTFPNKVTK